MLVFGPWFLTWLLKWVTDPDVSPLAFVPFIKKGPDMRKVLKDAVVNTVVHNAPPMLLFRYKWWILLRHAQAISSRPKIHSPDEKLENAKLKDLLHQSAQVPIIYVRIAQEKSKDGKPKDSKLAHASKNKWFLGQVTEVIHYETLYRTNEVDLIWCMQADAKYHLSIH